MDKEKREKGSRKVCYFCSLGKEPDYKNVGELGQFIFEDGRIKSSKATHLCPKHQRTVKRAIENARIIALLPIPGIH